MMFKNLYPSSNTKPKPMARPKTSDIVFFLAVTEGERAGIRDLIESLECYLECRYEILFADDSTNDETGQQLIDAGFVVVRNPTKMGWWGNSYTIRRAAKCAIIMFDAPFYIKLDPDALMIGPGLLSRIKGFSESHPEAGVFGNYMFTPTGQERSFSYWAKKMAQNQEHLSPPLRCALDNGYKIGSGVQGGAYCLTRACLKKMDGHGYLDKWKHHYGKGRGIVEDHIMTMLTYAVGYTAMDFGLSGQPFACKHRELAMLPHELIRDGRILIHPLKHNDTTSAKNRNYFRRLRRENEK